ncbi:MAG: RNase adapter RapZ [Gammaproteobacteria bacterium]|nr:RNase adapter RapZ [Gammaproteobacteria bacterium]MDH5692599.1 RNase adapter RapZ [Gammaproteobacteria bacterium]
MKLVVVSGLSGSGKSTVLHALEDVGYYCVDNLPIGLITSFISQIKENPRVEADGAAIGVDARNPEKELKQFSEILDKLKALEIKVEVVFLTADNATLVKRFSETRRRHPLTHDGTSLEKAIAAERRLLDAIAVKAGFTIDTSHTNMHQLRDLIRGRLVDKAAGSMSLLFQSFGFKHGVPTDADMVFDVRCLPNPYWDPKLRDFSGKDPQVVKYLESQSVVGEMADDLERFINRWLPRFKEADRTYFTVAIGCTGGMHRSVYLVEKLAQRFKSQEQIIVRHRELE